MKTTNPSNTIQSLIIVQIHLPKRNCRQHEMLRQGTCTIDQRCIGLSINFYTTIWRWSFWQMFLFLLRPLWFVILQCSPAMTIMSLCYREYFW